MLEFLNYTIKDDVKPFEMCWISSEFQMFVTFNCEYNAQKHDRKVSCCIMCYL